ncbi:MAG: hypothetical protein ABR574_01400 [Cryomorphaceae bacterium]
MKIIPIKDRFPDDFYVFPNSVYRDLPYRPEEDREQTESLLKFAKQSFELFLITDFKNVRLLGIYPPEKTTAYFGFWEAANHFTSSKKAFDLLIQKMSQRGYKNLEGPIHFNTFHRYRLRLQSPSWGMFNREPVNPEYYPTFLEKLGFRPKHTYESRLIKTEVVPEVYQSKKDLVASVRDLPFEFIPLSEEIWVERETEVFELINTVFGLNPGFQSISIEEFRLLYNADYAAGLCPHTSVLLAERNTGKLVAISLCHPNYKSLSLSEKPVFTKHYPLLNHRTLLAKTQGVHPDHRKQGLMNYLGAYGMLTFRKFYDDIIFCLMRADNPSLRFTDAFDYEKVEYATYVREI